MEEWNEEAVVSDGSSEALFAGMVLYAVALTFLLDLAYLLTGRASQLSGDELYRAGMMIFTLGSIVAVLAWVMRFTAHKNRPR